VQVPFVNGGAELLSHNLRKSLLDHGHQAEIITVPFKWYPAAEILRQMLIWEMIDLNDTNGQHIDLVIALKFPAYVVQHPNKVIWLLHQHRQAYEIWGTEYADMLADDAARVRDLITRADQKYIPEAKKVFTISRTVSDRLKKYNNIDSEPLYQPPPNLELLRPGICGDYIFYPSRLDPMKRHRLLVEAMSFTRSGAKCLIAGVGPEEEVLKKLIKAHKLGDRVQLLGFVSPERLASYYADALAVFFGPYHEDYGYVTLEAFYSQKPVITLTDSGGALEFVKDRVNGLVSLPEPEQIAAAIDSLFENRTRAVELGRRGFATVQDLQLSWNNVVQNLTS
jgi:glycosyltransferase involved in cell wall biosynthesis